MVSHCGLHFPDGMWSVCHMLLAIGDKKIHIQVTYRGQKNPNHMCVLVRCLFKSFTCFSHFKKSGCLIADTYL